MQICPMLNIIPLIVIENLDKASNCRTFFERYLGIPKIPASASATATKYAVRGQAFDHSSRLQRVPVRNNALHAHALF